VVLVYGTGANTQTVTADGGLGGLGGTGAFNGAPGGPGKIIKYNLTGDGT